MIGAVRSRSSCARSTGYKIVPYGNLQRLRHPLRLGEFKACSTNINSTVVDRAWTPNPLVRNRVRDARDYSEPFALAPHRHRIFPHPASAVDRLSRKIDLRAAASSSMSRLRAGNGRAT